MITQNHPANLHLFEPHTAEWFTRTLGNPTPVQEAAWPAIAEGSHVLVSAPTGTGKTLSAFLVFLDRFRRLAAEDNLKQELYLVYVSPLKSLAADIRENLDPYSDQNAGIALSASHLQNLTEYPEHGPRRDHR